MTIEVPGEIARIASGLPGLDEITNGGLPTNRLTLVAGTAGSGKTIFAAQYLAEGVARGEPGVFVTFEERPEATRQNLRSLGMRIEEWEAEGSWRFVNASPRFDEDVVVAGIYDLSSLILRVRHAVDEVGAKRVAIDSIGALIGQFEERGPARNALFQLGYHLERVGATTVMTAERNDDYGPIGRFGFEEFVADNVVILRNALAGEKRRRTIEVLKLRGGSHAKGEHLFALVRGRGLIVVPQEHIDFGYGTSRRRLPSGNTVLDEMLHGGFYDKSLILVTGTTGTGKSLVSTQFIAGGLPTGERSLLLSFEESRDQLVRNATNWGLDFEEMERAGRLRILAEAPESAGLEDHLLNMKAVVEEFQPDRVAIDSLTALQRISTMRSFREYLLGLTFHIKTNALLGLVTTTDDSHPDSSLTQMHISTICDTIMVLEYVAVGAEMRRGLSVLKMRGSDHDKRIREFQIDDDGMHIGDAFGAEPWVRFSPIH